MLPFAVFRCLLLFISGILNSFRSVDAPRMHFSLPMCAICTLNFKKSDKKKCHINWLHMCSQTQKRFRSYSYKPFSIECAGYKQKITNHIIDFASHTISIEGILRATTLHRSYLPIVLFLCTFSTSLPSTSVQSSFYMVQFHRFFSR